MVKAMKKALGIGGQTELKTEQAIPHKPSQRFSIKSTVVLPNGRSFTTLHKNILNLKSGKAA